MTFANSHLVGSLHIATTMIVQPYSRAFGRREFCKEASHAPHTLSVH